MEKDTRLDLLTKWVRQFDGFSGACPVPVSVDASFRRYFRIEVKQDYIVMDAPPWLEDTKRYITISGYLAGMGLNCPRVLKADIERGFLLLTDLGSIQYLEQIRANQAKANTLYRDAIDALLVIQKSGVSLQTKLPSYDDRLLYSELSLFREWLCERHAGLIFTDEDEYQWQLVCQELVGCALAEPKVFVHRDYHSRNLMVMPENNPGILDFQDAAEGPYTYDLVSLLKDCYVKWPQEVTRSRAHYFFEKMEINDITKQQFLQDFDLMGVQRHLKAAGIFARLLHRDKKTRYVNDVPRTLSYILDIAPRYPALKFLSEVIELRLLPVFTETI